MALDVITTTRATRQIAEAYEWYEQRVTGLGEQFLAALDEQFASIKVAPSIHAETIPGVRRALMKRFPFGVFYARHGETIAVLAVVHQARDPRRWPKSPRR